jgi:alcohol dehydrogenase
VFDNFGPEDYAVFRSEMTEWLAQGRLHYTEQVVEGLEAAPASLNDVLEGRNFGKMVIRVG